jgi:hypothetical protein
MCVCPGYGNGLSQNQRLHIFLQRSDSHERPFVAEGVEGEAIAVLLAEFPGGFMCAPLQSRSQRFRFRWV